MNDWLEREMVDCMSRYLAGTGISVHTVGQQEECLMLFRDGKNKIIRHVLMSESLPAVSASIVQEFKRIKDDKQ